MQYIQVWAWNDLAKDLVQSGVKKGSKIWADGFLELEEYVMKDGTSRDKRLKLKLTDWGKEIKKELANPHPTNRLSEPPISSTETGMHCRSNAPAHM